MKNKYSSINPFRKKRPARIMAVTLLLVLTGQISLPNVVFAGSGPKQPEYLGYESGANSEMVNPLTGDFTYNIPLLEVPGPEGGFSMPLTYRAGIKLEDEASWVGLGWSLNPGAIVRQVNNYPDDASGEVTTYKSYNSNGQVNWSGKIPAIQEQSIKSETSFRGVMEQLVNGMAKEFVWNLFGLGGMLFAFVTSFFNAYEESQRPNPSEPIFDFEKKDVMYGPLYFGSQHEWHDNTGALVQNGPTYHHPVTNNYPKVPVFRKLANFSASVIPHTDRIQAIASDVHRHVISPVSSQTDPGSYWSYKDGAKEPSSIAYDNYQVMGPGISGQIKPYRLETGSVSTPSFLTYRPGGQSLYADHNKYNVVPFIGDYKVGFRYEGYPANQYMHHTFTANQTGLESNGSTLTLTDSRLYNPPIRTEDNRKGLIISPISTGYKRTLVQGRHVNWYANSELQNAASRPPGFIECPEAANGNIRLGQTPAMRANNPKKIGAFSVTAENGNTYHYSLPVYSFGSKTVRQHSDNPYFQQLTSYNFTETSDNDRFAQAWLLTAITGPDFVDKGELGKIDKEDQGYWIKMEYGRYNDYFYWRKPFMVAGAPPFLSGYRDFNNGNIYSYSQGSREGYYLNAVKTRSHTAIFIKETRTDAWQDVFAITNGPPSNMPANISLKLSEIILLKNEDMEKLANGLDGNTPAFNLNTNNNSTLSPSVDFPLRPAAVYDMNDITVNAAIQNYIHTNMVKRIVFNYNYSLCPGYMNNINEQYAGNKLTLIGIKTYLAGNVQENAGYKFGYGYNPAYSLDKYDAFGYYNSFGTWSDEKKMPSPDLDEAGLEGSAWSIKHILNPAGVTTTVHYDRDTYSRISENILPADRPGDGIRVKRIDVSEGNTKYSTRYFYTDNLSATGRSTGVITKEPASYKNTGTPHYHAYDYPGTPVMYSKVTVLTGPYGQYPYDYNAKTEYHYHTPESAMLSVQRHTTNGSINSRALTNVLNTITVNTGLIGQPKAIYKFNRRGELEIKTAYNYTNNIPFNTNSNVAGQGKFTESTVSMENITGDYFFTRTIKTYLPTVLASVTTTTNNISSSTQNEVWDFFTAQVTETSTTNGLGVTYWNKLVPAYEVLTGQTKKYPEMGLKGENDNYKNMLAQPAETYSYKKTGANTFVPLGAAIQTWKKDWGSYRVLNGSGNYTESNAGPQVWRPHRSYAWNGKALNTDGTLKDFTPFNWAQEGVSGQNINWLKANEITRYDAYSKVLESMDANGNYAAAKTDNRLELVLANAQNARYTEIAYSGAEDMATAGYFGGEVQMGQWPARVTTARHTGTYSLSINPGGMGFIFRGSTGAELVAGRRYRASVWVHKSDVENGGSAALLYAHTNGASLASVTSVSPGVEQAGEWKLLNIYFNAPAQNGQPVEVYCKSNSPVCYVDDFRFHPAESPLTANVFDPQTGQPIYTLDNDNLYTAYEYNSKKRLEKVYRETLGPASATVKKLAKEYAYNDPLHKVYYNTPISGGSFTRQNCPGVDDGRGWSNAIPYTLPAGEFSSEYSQEDAQAKAQAEYEAKGQVYANTYGQCECYPLYYEYRRICFKNGNQCSWMVYTIGPNCTSVLKIYPTTCNTDGSCR